MADWNLLSVTVARYRMLIQLRRSEMLGLEATEILIAACEHERVT